MCLLIVHLFGKFQVQRDGQNLDGWNARKGQELLAYLLLYRERTHTRQALAELLWPESSTEQSMKYLRHTLGSCRRCWTTVSRQRIPSLWVSI